MACAAERLVDQGLARIGIHRRYYSQKAQDRWVIQRALPGRSGGYFVEIGAGDGRTHSNTYALERDHGWRGLLIEPNPAYAAPIARMRTGTLVHACVDRLEGEASFLALGYMGGLIGEDTDYALSRRRSVLRRHAAKIVQVPCRTLVEILDTAEAPTVIDYMSIDIEGAEFRALETFPFDRYAFRALTIERPTSAIHALLTAAGYVLDRVYLYDGFYVSREVAAEIGIKERRFSGTPRKFF